MTGTPDGDETTAEAQLQSFLGRFDPQHQQLFRSVRAVVRQRFPTANELAYAYPDSVVVGYSATERGIDGILSIAVRADGVRLYLMNGPQLPDPQKLLLGSAKQVRFVQVEAASQLAEPDVDALIAAAVDRAAVSFPAAGRGSLIVKSAGATRRPSRRPRT